MSTHPRVMTHVSSLDSTSGEWEGSAPATGLRAGEVASLPGCTASAPLRLDVMGGLGEYTGGLVLNLPLSPHIEVSARWRPEPSVAVTASRALPTPARHALVSPFEHLRAGGREWLALDRAITPESGDLESACTLVLGAWLEGVRRGLLPEPLHGMRLEVEGLPPPRADVGLASALCAATLVACARLAGADLDPAGAIHVCADVESVLTGLACGIGDAVSALTGERGALTQARCGSGQIGPNLHLPEGSLVVAVLCGGRDPQRTHTHRTVRAATQMGRLLIERILAHENDTRVGMGGLLSRLTMTDFVERFRDRLPTKISGGEFLERFGDPGDPHAPVDPREVYKVRSRTEHHIYENMRASQFAERLSHYARNKERQRLIDAGELMYASHWSYGQRCGMICVAADRLVTLLRRRGHDAGIFGAKTAGRGCGGLVAALIEDTPTARGALEDACREFAEQHKFIPECIYASADGALRSPGRTI